MDRVVRKLAVFIVNRVLRGYVEEFDEQQLNTDLWNGRVKLQNAKIAKDALISRQIPFAVNHGQFGEVDISFPWGNLDKQSCCAIVRDCFIHASVYVDALPLTNVEMKPDLPQISDESAHGRSALEYFINVDTIIDNIELSLENLHIRIDVGTEYAFGIKLDSIRTFPVDEKNEKSFIRDSPPLVRRRIMLNGLSFYFDKNPMPVTPETFAEAMSMVREHQYLLNPFSFQGTLERNKLDGDVQFRNKVFMQASDMRLSIDRTQLLGVMQMGREVLMFNKRRLYAPYGRPNRYPKSQRSSGLWWRFVQNCAHANRERHTFSPEVALEILRNRQMYHEHWLQTIRGEESQADLLDLEDRFDPVVVIGLRTCSSSVYFYRKAEVDEALSPDDVRELDKLTKRTGRNCADIAFASVVLEVMNEERKLMTDFVIVSPCVSAEKNGFDISLGLKVEKVCANNRSDGKRESVVVIQSTPDWPISLNYCSSCKDLKYFSHVRMSCPTVEVILNFEWIASIVEFTKHDKALVLGSEQPNEAANMLLINGIIDQHPSIGLDMQVQGVRIAVPYLESTIKPTLVISSELISLVSKPNTAFDSSNYETLYETYTLRVANMSCSLYDGFLCTPFNAELEIKVAIASSDLFPVSKTRILLPNISINVGMRDLFTIKEMLSYIADTFPESLESTIKQVDKSFIPESLLFVSVEGIELGLWHENVHFFSAHVVNGPQLEMTMKGVDGHLKARFERLYVTEFISGDENPIVDAALSDGFPITGSLASEGSKIDIQLDTASLFVRPKPFNYIYVLTKKIETYAVRLKLPSSFDYELIRHHSSRVRSTSSSNINLCLHINDVDLYLIPENEPVLHAQTRAADIMVDVDNGVLLLNLVLGNPVVRAPHLPELDMLAEYKGHQPLTLTVTETSVDVVVRDLFLKITPTLALQIGQTIKTITNGHGFGHSPPDFPYLHFSVEAYNTELVLVPHSCSSEYLTAHLETVKFVTETVPYVHNLTLTGLEVFANSHLAAKIGFLSVSLDFSLIRIPKELSRKFADIIDSRPIPELLQETRSFLEREHPLDVLAHLDFWIMGISLNVTGVNVQFIAERDLLSAVMSSFKTLPVPKFKRQKREIPFSFSASASLREILVAYQLCDNSSFQIRGEVSAVIGDTLQARCGDIELMMICGSHALPVPLSLPFDLSWSYDRGSKRHVLNGGVIKIDFSVDTILFVARVLKEIRGLVAEHKFYSWKDKEYLDINQKIYDALVSLNILIDQFDISFASAMRPMVLFSMKDLKLGVHTGKDVTFTTKWSLGYSNLVSEKWMHLIEPAEFRAAVNPAKNPAVSVGIPRLVVNLYEQFIRDIMAFEEQLKKAFKSELEQEYLEYSIWVVNEMIENCVIQIDGEPYKDLSHGQMEGIPHTVSKFEALIGTDFIPVKISLSEVIYDYYPIPQCYVYMTAEGARRIIHISTPYELKNNTTQPIIVSCGDIDLGVVIPESSVRLPYTREQRFSIRLAQIDEPLSRPIIVSASVCQAHVVTVNGCTYCVHNEIDDKRTQMNVVVEDMITVQNLLPIPINIAYRERTRRDGRVVPIDPADKVSLIGLNEHDDNLLWCVLFGEVTTIEYSLLSLRNESTERITLSKSSHISVMVSNEYNEFTKKCTIVIYASCIVVNKTQMEIAVATRKKDKSLIWQDFTDVGGEKVLVLKQPKDTKNLQIQVAVRGNSDFETSYSPVLDCLKIGTKQEMRIQRIGEFIHVPLIAQVTRAPYPYEFSNLVVLYSRTMIVNKLDTSVEITVPDFRTNATVTLEAGAVQPLPYGNIRNTVNVHVNGYAELAGIPINGVYHTILKVASENEGTDMMVEIKVTQPKLVRIMTLRRARLPAPVTLANVTSTQIWAYQKLREMAVLVPPFTTSIFPCESPKDMGASMVIRIENADLEISFAADTTRRRLKSTRFWYEVKTIRYGYQMVIISESKEPEIQLTPFTFSATISQISAGLIDRNMREMLLLSLSDIIVTHYKRKHDMYSMFSIKSMQVDDLFSGAVLPVVALSSKGFRFMEVEATSTVGTHQLRSFQKILLKICPLTLNIDLALVSDMITYSQGMHGEPEISKVLVRELDLDDKEDKIIGVDRYWSVGELEITAISVNVTFRGRTKRITTLPDPKGVPMNMIRFIPNVTSDDISVEGCQLIDLREDFNRLLFLIARKLARNLFRQIWKSIGSIDLIGNPRLLYRRFRYAVANPTRENWDATVAQVKKGAGLFCRSVADLARGVQETPTTKKGLLGILRKNVLGKVAGKISEVTTKGAEKLEQGYTEEALVPVRMARVVPLGIPMCDARLMKIQHDVQVSAKEGQKPRWTEKLIASTSSQEATHMLCCFDHYIVVYHLAAEASVYIVAYTSIEKFEIINDTTIAVKLAAIREFSFVCESREDAETLIRVITSHKNSQRIASLAAPDTFAI